jgi:beta-lactamase regulating signal transducer with metallopeptidase domain/ankyrin repeat protein
MTSDLTAIFRVVLEASWQSSFIIVLILLVRPLMGARIPAKLRYLLWSLVLLRLLIPIAAFPSSPVSIQNIALVDQPPLQAESIPSPFHDTRPSSGFFRQSLEAAGSSSVALSSPRTLPISISWWSVAAVIWLAGMLMALGVVICAQIQLHRRLGCNDAPLDSAVLAIWTKCCLRLRIKKSPAVCLSAEVDSPALVGLIRPILLLPERSPTVFSREDWENVFVHELAHYQRRDHWTHAVQLIALSVHWFNPLVWLGFRQLRADRELAADEWALQHLEPERATGYGDTLLKVLKESSDNRLSVAAVGILEDRMQLKQRLQRIVEFSPKKLIGSIVGLTLLATIGAVALTDSRAQKQTDAPVALALGPQEVLIQSIVKDDAALAEQALKNGAQPNLETEYIHKGFIDQNTPLYFAAEKGELDLVRLFVGHGASVKPGKSTWTNPLDAALRNGFPAVAAYLHDHGATSNPLVYAAGTGDMAELTKLTAAGKPRNLDEAASTAAGCGQLPALAALLAKGAHATKAFQRAASTGSVESMRYLVGYGIDIHAAGYEALGHAAYNNRTEATAFLLKAGVNPNRQKQPGDTRFTEIDPPLNQAARAGAVSSVKLLLEAGADPNSVVVTDPGYGSAGNTPLCEACQTDSDEVVRLLLDHGAGLETVTSGGFTPALYAAYSHAARCLALLIDRGANLKAWNPIWKCGLLDFAAIFNGEDKIRQGIEIPTVNQLNQCMATLQVLLDHGMDVNSVSREGFSLLSVSIINGQSAWTDMLLQQGAKINTVDQYGGTPLIHAIMSMGQVKNARYYAVLNELLARGADPNLGNNNPIAGKDALPSAFKAAICGFGADEMRRKTVAILLAHGARFSVPKNSDADKLLLAATAGDTDGVGRLLKQGVSPNVADSKGWTPLLSAAALGYDAILKMLVEAGADVNAHDVMGLNALWFTSQRYSDLADFHLLLDKGADVNADSSFMFYYPVLYEAIERHDPVLLADLLKHRASPNLLPGDHPDRFEPLEMAVDQLMENFGDQKRRDVVTMLIAAGANRNPNEKGYRVSLLYFPVENNMIDMVKFLLNAGVDPKKDKDGGKALSDTLERHGSKEMKSLMEPVLGKT